MNSIAPLYGTTISISDDEYEKAASKVEEKLTSSGYEKKTTGETVYYTKTTTTITLGILDVNFFRSTEVTDSHDGKVSSTILAPVVSNVYRVLRNLCLVLMMLVLLYIGIRILLSSSATDKSKYKTWLTDWLVGFCLLFAMQYIMSFLMNMNTLIVEMLSNDEGDSYYFGLYELADGSEKVSGGSNEGGSEWNAVIQNVDSDNLSTKKSNYVKEHIVVYKSRKEKDNFEINNYGIVQNATSDNVAESDYTSDYDPKSMIQEWATNGKLQLNAFYVNGDKNTGDQGDWAVKGIAKLNLMEYVGVIAHHETGNKAYIVFFNGRDKVDVTTDGVVQESKLEDNVGHTGWVTQYAYVVLYIALVIEVLMFVVIYIKRVFSLAMYTMLAPLVAFMYPIDKFGDQKAQAFNTWLKDYFFTLLLQPMHLLLYTVFIVGTGDLLNNNPFYALCMYAMMIVGEKYIKNIFGFQNAKSGGGGGMANSPIGPLAMDAARRITGMGPGSHGGGRHSGGSSGNSQGKTSRIGKRKYNGSETNSNTPKSSGGNNTTNVSALSGRNKNKTPKNSNSAIPTSSGKNGRLRNAARKAGNGLKSNAKAFGNAANRKITNAVTGGKYNNLKGKGVGAHVGAAAKNLAATGGKKLIRTTARTAGRAASITARGIVGTTLGAAVAVATGDEKNLITGATVGVASGWNKGGRLGDSIADRVISGGSDFIDDMQQYKSDTDQAYHDKMRITQESNDLFDNGVEIDEAGTQMINDLAPIYDFNGDEKKYKNAMNAYQLCGGNIQRTMDTLNVIDNNNLNTEQGKKDAIRQQTLIERKRLKPEDYAVSEDEIKNEKERIKKANQQERAAKNAKEAEDYKNKAKVELDRKMKRFENEQIAAGKNEQERAKAKIAKENAELRKINEQYEKIKNKKYVQVKLDDEKIASRLEEQKKQAVATQRAEEIVGLGERCL